MSSTGGDVSISGGADGTGICTYGAEGGRGGNGGADGYVSAMSNDGGGGGGGGGGESRMMKCVGEIERCGRVVGEGVRGTALIDGERPRPCSMSTVGGR